MENNTKYCTKQQFPGETHNKPEYTNAKKKKIHQKQDKDENKKWATFIYHSPQIRKLTDIFKQSNINIKFKSTNTIQRCTKPKTPDKNQEYNMSGLYKLTCNT